MGVSVSRYSDLTDNEYLARFVSEEIITPNDPFWNKLLSYNIVPPKNAEEQLFFDSSTERLLYKLLENNLQTGNVGSLVRVFIARASELLAAPSSDNVMLAWQTFNALFVIRSVAKYLIETVPEYQLCQHFDVAISNVMNGGSASGSQTQADGITELAKEAELIDLNDKQTSQEQQATDILISKSLIQREQDMISKSEKSSPKLNSTESKLEMLIDALVGLIIDVPVTNNTYYLHLECLNMVLVLMSVYMFAHVHGQQRVIENSLIYRTLYLGRYSMHAPLLVRALLNNFSIPFCVPEQMFGAGSSQGSFVLGFASGLWSVLTYGRRPVQEPALEHSLASQSCLLLLALVNHCCDHNLYRTALLSCVDISSDQMPTTPHKNGNMEVSPPRIDMALLHKALCATAEREHTTLLLYLMLHACKAYKRFVSTVTDIENLILPILRCLYSAPDSNSHHIYMSLIIILILSEDDAIDKNIHHLVIKNPTWYTERSLSEISLGGLMILVILRTVQYNILRVRDQYLHTNCLAALANMSGEFRNLHPYVAQRLVSLYEIILKRKHRLEERAGGNLEQLREIHSLDVSKLSRDDKEEALWDSIFVLDEVLRMLLEILNSCLTNQLPNNLNLVYALLYKKDLFQAQENKALMQNIQMVVGFFSSRLQRVQEHAGGDLGVSEVLAAISKSAEQWSSDRLKKFPALKFRYVEEERPEEFFTPYVWSLVGACGAVCWASEAGARAHSDLVNC